MKKKLVAILLLLGTSLLVFAGCNSGKRETEDREESEKKEFSDIFHQRPTEKEDPDIYVTYYGCPNSKRVRRLNTRKRRLET